jgi:putative transposase
MPAQYLPETTVAACIQTRAYQAPLRHTACAQPLNGVILTKLNLRTHAQAHVILLSRDLPRASAPLVDDDRVRCHIALNCRDATQHWGLEDFRDIPPTGVTHAANLALFLVKMGYHLPSELRQHDPAYSILDLPAACRGDTAVAETIKRLPEKPAPM